MIRTALLIVGSVLLLSADSAQAQRVSWLGDRAGQKQQLSGLPGNLSSESYAEEWAVGGAIVFGIAGGLFTRAACFGEVFGPGDCGSLTAFVPGAVVGALVGAGVGWLIGKQLPQAPDHGG